MFKVEGVLSLWGTPKWTDYYCSERCMESEGFERGDADVLLNDDLKHNMNCFRCGRNLIAVMTGNGRYPAEVPSQLQ